MEHTTDLMGPTFRQIARRQLNLDGDYRVFMVGRDQFECIMDEQIEQLSEEDDEMPLLGAHDLDAALNQHKVTVQLPHGSLLVGMTNDHDEAVYAVVSLTQNEFDEVRRELAER